MTGAGASGVRLEDGGAGLGAGDALAIGPVVRLPPSCLRFANQSSKNEDPPGLAPPPAETVLGAAEGLFD